MSFDLSHLGTALCPARTGTLYHLPSPCVFLCTRWGVVPHLTPDHLVRLSGSFGLSLSLPDLMGPPEPVLETMGAHGLWNARGKILLAVDRKGGQKEPNKGNDHGIGVRTNRGMVRVMNKEYTALMDKARMDVVVAMSDEVTVEASVGRCRKAVDRSVKWLEEMVEERKNKEKKSLLWAAVQGGGSIQSREICAEKMANLNVDGFVIGGLGFGEDLAKRREIIKSVIVWIFFIFSLYYRQSFLLMLRGCYWVVASQVCNYFLIY